MSTDSDDLDTMTIPGMGEVPSPQAVRENKDGRKKTVHINAECPVCGKGPYSTFAKLRGHFGNKSGDPAHQQYDLSVEEFR
jgi:hypothetical protein